MLPALLAAVCLGALIGFALRLGIDYAELTAYRRIARADDLR